MKRQQHPNVRRYVLAWLAPINVIAALSLIGCAGPLDNDQAGPRGLSQTPPRHAAPLQPSYAPDTSTMIDGPLNLDLCLKLALAQNPGLKAQADDAGRAGAEASVARSQNWPKLDAVTSYTHSLDDARLVPARYNGESGAFSRDILSGDLVLSMPLFTGGQITHRIKAGELLQAAAEHRLVRSEDELVYNTTSVFYHILAQQRLIESIEFSQKAMEEQRQRITQLIEAQKAAKVDLLRTQVRLANIQQQLIQERNRLAIQRRVLGTLLGLHEQSVQITGELDAQIAAPSTRPLTTQVLSRRADYLAAATGVEAERHQLEAARGARWPQISARASYGGRYGIDADTSDGTNDLEDVASVGVFGTVPLFDGGEIAASVLRQRFAVSARRQRLQELALRIDLEIESAWLDVQSAAQRIDTTSAAVQQAQESLRIEREKYNQGKGAVIDVLDAQAALLEAQTTYYQALADYNIALAALELADGAR